MNLDQKLEAWARWELTPETIGGAGKSLFEKLQEGGGEILPPSTAGQGSAPSTSEKISLAVTRLAQINPRAANVLRAEYGLITLPGVSPTDTQATRAKALGVPSLRTYRRVFKSARDFITEQLLKNKG